MTTTTIATIVKMVESLPEPVQDRVAEHLREYIEDLQDEVQLNTTKYKIILRESEEGFSVSCPGLPGCWSQGDTEEEAIENIQDAIQEYLLAIEDTLQGVEFREVEVAA